MDFSRTVQSASAAVLFLLLGGLVIGILLTPRAMTDVFAAEMAIRPWELGVLLVALVLFGALLFRKVTLRMFLELLTGFFLLLGVWFLAWRLWGEPGLFVAAILTMLQAWIRTVWMHNVFVLVGAAGAVAYLAFLLPLFTWVALFAVLAISEVVVRRPSSATAQMMRSVMHRGIVPLILLPATSRGFGGSFVNEAQAGMMYPIGVTALVLPGMVIAHLSVMHVLLAVGAVVGFAGAAGAARWRPWSLLLSLALVALVSFVGALFFV